MAARIDAFLDILLREGAERLVLRAGEHAVLVKGGHARRVSREPLSPNQIDSLLGEITPPDAPSEFRYAIGPGAVRVEVTGRGEEVAAAITAANGAARGALGEGASADSRGAARERMGELLGALVATRGSDLHLRVGEPPVFRVDGDIRRRDEPAFEAAELEAMLVAVMPERNRAEWLATGDTDFAHEIPALARFRVNAARDRRGPVAVLRAIPTRIRTADELGLPEAVQRLCQLSKGLVLVTGATGSGKSTTLAALVDLINRTRSDHIVTIEDPIEFVHENRKCLVTQREVGTHTAGFRQALRAALREDPDVVLVGELRDLETIAIAIETAETGHLVFGTLHTTTAASTIDRVIDQFPEDRQAQIRVMLSESLRAVIAQTLCRKIGGGRVAAREILLTTPAVANLIREGKTFQIPSVMQTSRRLGMTTLNDALLDLVEARHVTPDEAYLRSVDKAGLARALAAKGHQVEAGTEVTTAS